MNDSQPNTKTTKISASQIKPQVVWLYGVSGSGKTTLSKAVAEYLKGLNIPCLVLDGDELRRGISKDLGFTMLDRYRNVNRAAEIARLACSQGLVVLVAMITPTNIHRLAAKRIINPLLFNTVFLECSLEGAAQRDVKGLYARAKAGKIPFFTGVDSDFNPPAQSENTINTDRMTLQGSVNKVLSIMSLTNGQEDV
jgi:adenylyl-sulfate kinase